MILNAYAVLDLSLSILRLLVGLLVVALAAVTWVGMRHRDEEGRVRAEDRSYLVLLLAVLLLGLNVVSWPLLYLLLQSYVSEWPDLDLMCIYGVTRVGLGSSGPGRFLPPLLAFLQIAKPALVFLSGTWFVLYLLNRQTDTGALLGRVLALLLVAGVFGVADAGAETAYVVIPKQQETSPAGCCVQAFDGPERAGFLLSGVSAGVAPAGVSWAYFGILGTLSVVLLGYAGVPRLRAGRSATLLLLIGAASSLPAGWTYLTEVAAPTILHLPYHHCPYDLLPRAPEAAVCVLLYCLGAFAVGWAFVARWMGSRVVPAAEGLVRSLLFLALCGYLGAGVMMAAELARA